MDAAPVPARLRARGRESRMTGSFAVHSGERPDMTLPIGGTARSVS